MKYKIKYSIVNREKRMFLLVAILGCCIYFSSCVKYNTLTSPEEGTIYMPQAFQDRGNLSLYKLDSPQTVYFGIAYGGFKSAATDITGNFEVDTSLVAQYNIDNAYLGNHYVVLPESSYTISGLSTVLKADSTSSAPLSLSITTSKLALGTHYLLPVKLTSVSSGKLDTSLTVTYFRIDTLNIRSRDLTAQAAFTFNYDDAPSHNDAGESAIHLVDNDLSTKYLLFTFHTDMYVQLKFPSATVINGYTLTSGGDAPERDPKDWNLAASNDGTNWTVIDSRANQVFSGRKQTIQFNTTNNTAYTYYRLNITANNNGNTGLFQCTEWRLLQFY
ncbi:MAG TPA: DUF1735 domain-containing protein [Arachidicoccus soli]|nr:DUF1735 domain-containing protein [Arachidicoccus soli]HEU0226511.1 DUF1735 domain-containing protein [Arachidicoccus soli]